MVPAAGEGEDFHIWVFFFFVGVVGGRWGRGRFQRPGGGGGGEEIALGRDREGFLANDDGDGERRTATLRRRR